MEEAGCGLKKTACKNTGETMQRKTHIYQQKNNNQGTVYIAECEKKSSKLQ